MKLGVNVKDKVTGFSGIALARTEYLYNPSSTVFGYPLMIRVHKECGSPVTYAPLGFFACEKCSALLLDAESVELRTYPLT